jgi:hypothetical protein
MPKSRPDIGKIIKRELKKEAGGKCANPGCSYRRTHIHHIREWAVYETHDSEHMIAVCPACHDAIHHGELHLSDETIYEWKTLKRSASDIRAHLYIEPSTETKIIAGTLGFAGLENFLIFQLCGKHFLKFDIVDQDILMVSLTLFSADGTEIIRIVDNHVRQKLNDNITFKHVPGKIEVTAPNSPDFIPPKILATMQKSDSTYGQEQDITLLSLCVVRPGVVRIKGLWADSNSAVIITEKELVLIHNNAESALVLHGTGENVVKYNGKKGGYMFGINPSSKKP